MKVRGAATMRNAWMLGVPLALAAPPAQAAEPFLSPVGPACISSPYGPRATGGPRASGFHNGIDLPAPAGTWVKAVAPGQVTSIRRIGAGGLEVTVRHADGLLTRYAHLGTVAPPFASGKRAVVAGEALGRVGRTGITYGTHLHLEVVVNGERVDPAPYFRFGRCGGISAGASTP